MPHTQAAPAAPIAVRAERPALPPRRPPLAGPGVPDAFWLGATLPGALAAAERILRDRVAAAGRVA